MVLIHLFDHANQSEEAQNHYHGQRKAIVGNPGLIRIHVTQLELDSKFVR